jgi:hypothetical protein
MANPSPDPAGARTGETLGFDRGVLFAAWWLHYAHGEDTYAADLLIEAVGRPGLDRMRRMARRDGFRFARGFWSDVKRKASR